MGSLPIFCFPPFLPQIRPRFIPTMCMSRKSAGKGGRSRAFHRELEVLYDDGYADAFEIGDYFNAANDLIQFDHGPPRWFCPVECGPPARDSPLLLFLPGVDGLGLGLYRHHMALGRIFEVRCMHVPLCDRTPFKGLVKFVEDALRMERLNSCNKSIYLLGHSLGGCLAISVAANNPDMNLVLILSNPATSFDKSRLRQMLPLLKSAPFGINILLPDISNVNFDYQVKLALGSIDAGQNPLQIIDNLKRNVVHPFLQIKNMLKRISGETVAWKLMLTRSAANDANSHLHEISAEVLLLASCNDIILSSKKEAERLQKSLPNCKAHYFDDHGHSLLLEDNVYLSTIIKAACLYHHSKKVDYILHFLPPSRLEFGTLERWTRWLCEVVSPVTFSTLDDGRVVRGLSGVPDHGPVLLVGNHMLLGVDLIPLFIEFLREKEVVLRGIAHPVLFSDTSGNSSQKNNLPDLLKSFYAVPVSLKNIYRLLAEKSFILLYPGGSREGLHRKGEEYKLFWSDHPEFVRMAARFGASIVPFGAVGEDDFLELFLDYDDLMSMPCTRRTIFQTNQKLKNLSSKAFGDERSQDLYWPWFLPKIPGRIYYLFGKPISTGGSVDLMEREAAKAMYWRVKSEVESSISYLINKRGEDQYRSIFQRALFQAAWGPSKQIPSFEP